jgi:hypothetical protein
VRFLCEERNELYLNTAREYRSRKSCMAPKAIVQAELGSVWASAVHRSCKSYAQVCY